MDVRNKLPAIPQTLDEYQRRVQQELAMETTPTSKVEVVDPSDNANFEKGLNELAE